MDERRLPLTEHLRDLRKRLRNAVIALLLAWVVCFYFAETLYLILARPLQQAMELVMPGKQIELKFGSLTEPFWVYFELAMYAGVFLASPVIFHQIWSFVAPGLYEREKKIAVPFAATSGLMFIGGAVFCYVFVFPAAFKFFLSYAATREFLGVKVGIDASLFMAPYLDLAMKMLLGFGLIFELPLAVFFLTLVGMVDHRKLWKFSKYWVVLSFIIGGILTPGPDLMSQLLMALPLIVLYNLSIGVSYIVTKRKEKARLLEEAELAKTEAAHAAKAAARAANQEPE
jgi:sec-independent protein translocase protein TatC